jgi:nitrogen fixation-related uncharacterized protein
MGTLLRWLAYLLPAAIVLGALAVQLIWGSDAY